MKKTLNMELTDYYVLNELRKMNIKENKNSIRAILIRKELCKTKKSIANMIDNNTLTFNEFYRLLKILEKRSSGKICIQNSRFYYEDDEFEDDFSVDGIRIIRDDTSNVDILFNDLAFDYEYENMKRCDNITFEELASPNISDVLLKMYVLCEDLYNKMINLIIAYLISRDIK